jgi:RNA polymerase sigma-70 factor (ECF subfamily)
VSERDLVALVRAMATRDQRALQALYIQTHRLVFTLIVRITGVRQTAEELTVDVFHNAWRKAATYDPANGSVIGWIMNQARSRAIDRLRFEQRKKRVIPATEDPTGTTESEGPQERVEVTQRDRRLQEALQVLTPDERQAIESAFFSELTYREVASRLDQPLGTVKTRIRSGLGKLRRALGAEQAL